VIYVEQDFYLLRFEITWNPFFKKLKKIVYENSKIKDCARL